MDRHTSLLCSLGTEVMSLFLVATHRGIIPIKVLSLQKSLYNFNFFFLVITILSMEMWCFRCLKQHYKIERLIKIIFHAVGHMVQAISEFPCHCYKPYESLMSRKNLLMYSLLENSGAAATLQSRAQREAVWLLFSPFPSAVFSLYGHKHHPMTGHTDHNHSAPAV